MAAVVKVGSLAGAIASASYVLARNPASAADRNLDAGSFFSGSSSSSAAAGPAAAAVAAPAPLKEQEKPRNDAPWKSAAGFDPEALERGAKAPREINASNHENKRSFVCPVENCGKQYKRQDHLNRHSLTHRGNLFPCTWEGCDLSFNVNANLQRHLKLHEKWGSTLRGSKKADTQLMCPESGCCKSFKYPSLLQTHVDHVHESLSISEAVCMEPGCGESFESPSQLRSHTKVAHCFGFCETCGVSMLKTSLAAHARKHQGEQVLLKCPHPGCLHSYSKNSNLNTHIRAVHMDLKPYACSHAGCEFRFAYKSVRDKHEQCRKHSIPSLGGDFEAEDSQHRLKSRGGRKRVRLQNVDDLLPRKWRNHFRHRCSVSEFILQIID